MREKTPPSRVSHIGENEATYLNMGGASIATGPGALQPTERRDQTGETSEADATPLVDLFVHLALGTAHRADFRWLFLRRVAANRTDVVGIGLLR